MAVLGKNACTPGRIFGPPSQYLFLGATVKSFTCSQGWGEQGSNLTVELVEDSCAGTKVWWDKDLNRQTGSVADPGFTKPDPGVAVYFRVESDINGSTEAERGGFEYCGLVQNWTASVDANGNPVYNVNITDPRVILQNTQIIVGKHVGNTRNIWNLINVYGYIESNGFLCTSSEAGGIGGFTTLNAVGNIANERGMVWNDVKCALHNLVSASDRVGVNTTFGGFAKDGRLVYVGPESSQEGYGVPKSDGSIAGGFFSVLKVNQPSVNLNVHHYLLDLTEIPFAPVYYRIAGPEISLAELISRVCEDVGCDYYIELLPVIYNGAVLKVIKVRVCARGSQPNLNVLGDFIQAKKDQATDAGGGIISYSSGLESRDEDTASYIIGGKRRELYQQPLANILPWWGYDADGNILQARTTGDNDYQVRLDFQSLNPTLETPLTGRWAWIDEYEMQAATASYKTWLAVVGLRSGDIHDYLTGLGIDFPSKFFADVIKGLKPQAALETWSKSIETSRTSVPAAERIHTFVRDYANEYYGKKFLVNAPFICYAVDTSDDVNDPLGSTLKTKIKVRYSHEPSPEGAWVPDATTTVLGLTHNSSATDFFRDDVGKYSPILFYELTSGLSATLSRFSSFTYENGNTAGFGGEPFSMGSDDYIGLAAEDFGTGVWVKGSIEPEVVRGTPLDPTAANFNFIVNVQNGYIGNRFDEFNNSSSVFHRMVTLFANKEKKEKLEAGAIKPDTSKHNKINPLALIPNFITFPYVSNVSNYGPWWFSGLPGSVSLVNDDGYVPWEYGSDVIMDTAALEKVSQSVTYMRKGERGQVQVAGFPNIPLGAELFSVDTASPPKSQLGQKYIGTRTTTLTNVCRPTALSRFIGPQTHHYVDMNAWNGEFGPNVTNINVSVGPNGFTTDYQFSTFTPRVGGFSKNNSERLKEIGQNRLKLSRQIRSKALEKAKFAGSVSAAAMSYSNTKKDNDSSPSEVVIGRYITPATGFSRTDLFASPLDEARYIMGEEETFTGTAVMSWDGFFRPASRYGQGGLPRYSIPQEVITTTGTGDGEVAFSFITGTYSGYFVGFDPPVTERTGIPWKSTYYDPFHSPTGLLPSGEWQALTGVGGVVTGYQVITRGLDGAICSYPNIYATGSFTGTSPSGHDINIVGRYTEQTNAPFAVREAEEQGLTGYGSDCRFTALRGPLVMAGWGRDKYGKPIPNAADSESAISSGIYETTGLYDCFLSGWLQKAHTWPVAPIDLVFDRENAVWRSPTVRSIVHARVTGDSDYINGWDTTSKNFFPLNFHDMWDASGNEIYDHDGTGTEKGNNPTGVTIEVEWPWTDISAHSNTGTVPVYWDENDHKYYGLPLGGATACHEDWMRTHLVNSLRPFLHVNWNDPAQKVTECRPSELITADLIISGCCLTGVSGTGQPLLDTFCYTGVSCQDCIEIDHPLFSSTGFFDLKPWGSGLWQDIMDDMSDGSFEATVCPSTSKLNFKHGFRVNDNGSELQIDATDWKVRFIIMSITTGVIRNESGSPLVEGVITACPVGRNARDAPLSYDKTWADSDLSGTISIYDPLGCFFSAPYDELVGRAGWAQLMNPHINPGCDDPVAPIAGYISPDSGLAEAGTTGRGLVCTSTLPRWEVFQLCCAPFECNGYF